MGKLDWFQKFQYRTNAIGMEDYEMMLRTYQTSRFAALPEILLGYRVVFLSIHHFISVLCNFRLKLTFDSIEEVSI